MCPLPLLADGDVGDVVTIYGETFTADESAKLAWLIYKRFGRDLISSAVAWRNMMGNDCDDHVFGALVERGRRLP
jgi:hypothetical protein